MRDLFLSAYIIGQFCFCVCVWGGNWTQDSASSNYWVVESKGLSGVCFPWIVGNCGAILQGLIETQMRIFQEKMILSLLHT